jgi:hypothetical protein
MTLGLPKCFVTVPAKSGDPIAFVLLFSVGNHIRVAAQSLPEGDYIVTAAKAGAVAVLWFLASRID